jgi:FAD/FMN-containing dehydrogenase
MEPPGSGVLDELRGVVGEAWVATDPDITNSFARDWTGRWVGATPAVVRPGSTAEVSGVLAVCHDHGVHVVPQGGNTGLVGGGVPLAGEVVLSLTRLGRLDPVDRRASQVTVGAGVALARLRRHAADVGLAYAVDLAARDTATVGGTVATNAGGLHVLRYGGTREQLRGIEAVLADGRVIRRLGGLRKDNTGYDLAGLLCGSEGTLGVVTAARLHLVPRYEARVVALLAFGDMDAALDAASTLRDRLESLEAVEFFVERGRRLVCDRLGLPAPFPDTHAAYLLVEAAGHRDPTVELAAAIEVLAGLDDAAVAVDPERRAALWRYREGHTEAINLLGPPHKFDVTLPSAALAPFAHEVTEAIDGLAPDATCHLFGHAADGNLHVNVSGLEPDDERVDDLVYNLVASHDGSISAEHGIGAAKRQWLHLVRSPEELAVFRAIKRALDPRGILNPRALLPPS